MKHHIKRWSESWVIPDLVDLVPELRKARKGPKPAAESTT